MRFIVILFLFPGYSAFAQPDSLAPLPTDSVVTPDSMVVELPATNDSLSVLADSIITFAKSFLGYTYKYGSRTPPGFDCSGFMHYVFTNNGVKVPRTSASYHDEGVEIPLDSARKGDIILFRGTDPKVWRIGHVGLVISEAGEPLHFIHSSSSKKHYGVTITDYHNSGYPKRFIRVIRILGLPSDNG